MHTSKNDEIFVLASEQETARLAKAISQCMEPEDCLTLQGDLGAGKTTLMRYLIAALQQKPTPVISPSFLLMQEYEIELKGKKTVLWHIDGYRLNNTSEIQELGLDELFSNAIVAIEWPERFEGFLPPDRLDIRLQMITGTERSVMIKGRGKNAGTEIDIGKKFHAGT